MYSDVIDGEGLKKPTNNSEDYAVSWCGWAYLADVTPAQMLGTIPKLKEMGIHWATLDDRWFNNYGDWQPRSDTFPGDEIRKMVRQFHEQGIKVQLWWLPLAVEDGGPGYESHSYGVSEVVKQHPDWLILDKNGKPARMTRNLATLCPAGGSGVLQTIDREIYSRLGFRRTQARQYL
jgi:alpha-galactosidase